MPRKPGPPVAPVGVIFDTGRWPAGSGLSGNGNLPSWTSFTDEGEYVPELLWPNSVRTYERMMSDSQAEALYYAGTLPIRRYKYVIDPNGAPDKMVNEISQDLNLDIKDNDPEPRTRRKRRFVHDTHLMNALRALFYGHMYFEQQGEIVDGLWRLRKLEARLPRSIAQFKIAEDGGLISIVQNRGSARRQPGGFGFLEMPEIKVNRLVGYVWDQEPGNWAGRSIMRSCYKNWLIKDRLLRVDAINHERAGGIPIGIAAEGSTPAEVAAIDAMASRLKIGERSGGGLPAGADMKVIRGTGSDVIGSVRYHDESMARRFLMMFMQLGQTQTGSRALGEEFIDFVDLAQESIANWYCDVTNEHVIEDWVDWNYGEEVENVPLLTYAKNDDPALSIADLAVAIDKKVITVDEELEEVIRSRYGLPRMGDSAKKVRGAQEELVLNPPAPPPATALPPKAPAKKPVGASAGTSPGAPSRSDPALVRASAAFVEVPDQYVIEPTPESTLVTVRNVPIAEVGVEYMLSTGPCTFTVEDLMDAVVAANDDHSIKQPRLKLGHIDPRYNDSNPYDGTPSFGKATNLRFDASDLTVYADYIGVPRWLAEIMPVAYPNKSVEAYQQVTAQSGKVYKMVITAVALLGVVWPGITTLDDLPNLAAYYGETKPDDVQVLLAGGDQMAGIAAAANLEDVRRAFYNIFATSENGRSWWWVRAVLLDPNQLIAEDDETGDLYRIPFEAISDDEVEFGDPVQVRLEYADKAPEQVAAKSAVVTGMTALAASSAVFTRADAPPHIKGGRMDPKLIRQALGLPEDASEEQVKAAFLAGSSGDLQANPPHDETGTSSPETRTGAPPVQSVSTGDNANDQVAPVVPEGTQPVASGEPVTEPVTAAGTMTVDAAAFAQMQADAKAGRDARDEQVKAARDGYIDQALRAGKFPASRREHYVALMAADEQGTRQMIDSLAPNLVPVAPIGTVPAAEGGATTEPYPAGWLPDMAAKRHEMEQRKGAFPTIHVEV